MEEKQTNVSWIYGEDRPRGKGWYAVMYCWEIEEGFFDDAYFWNGKEWDYYDGIPVPISNISSKPFPDRESAEKWARENNLT